MKKLTLISLIPFLLTVNKMFVILHFYHILCNKITKNRKYSDNNGLKVV